MLVRTWQFNERSLSANLRGNLVVRESVSREDGDLLTSGNGVHDVDGGDPGLDHLLRVDPRVGIDRLTLRQKTR